MSRKKKKYVCYNQEEIIPEIVPRQKRKEKKKDWIYIQKSTTTVVFVHLNNNNNSFDFKRNILNNKLPTTKI